jgi:excisionase family DNA binding protein
MSEAPIPLFVRLAADAARRLDEVVSSSGSTKRQVVQDALRAHLDDGFVVGRATLREDPHEVLTAGEAGALLQIGTPEVEAAADAGELPGRRIAGQWRFSRTALIAWLGEAQQPSEPGATEG